MDELFGTEFTFNEKTWIVLRRIGRNLVEAVEKDVSIPAPVMLVQFNYEQEQKETFLEDRPTIKKGV